MPLENLPIGYQLKARVSGITALYALFVIGCLAISIVAFWRLPEGLLLYIIISVSLVFFFGLVGFGCYIIYKMPERFAMKEEQHIIIEHRMFKMLDQEPMLSRTKPGPPISLHQSENEDNQQKET